LGKKEERCLKEKTSVGEEKLLVKSLIYLNQQPLLTEVLVDFYDDSTLGHFYVHLGTTKVSSL